MRIRLLDLPVFYYLLASHTESYTQMLTSGATWKDFRLCKEIIFQLQAETSARKSAQGTTVRETSFSVGGEKHS